MAAAIRLSQQHSCSLPDASRAPDRKDSTPRHGRLLHPFSWAERDDRDHAADNFFQGGSPKNRSPHFPARTSSPPEIVSPNFRGWRLDENLKPKSPPTGGGTHKKLGDKGKMAVLAFSQARLRCDGPCQSRSRAISPPSRCPRPSQVAFAPCVRLRCRSSVGRVSRPALSRA